MSARPWRVEGKSSEFAEWALHREFWSYSTSDRARDVVNDFKWRSGAIAKFRLLNVDTAEVIHLD